MAHSGRAVPPHKLSPLRSCALLTFLALQHARLDLILLHRRGLGAQVEETPQVLMLRAQVSLQDQRMSEAEASIQGAMAQALLLWWGLPSPGAAMQVLPLLCWAYSISTAGERMPWNLQAPDLVGRG